MQLSTSQLLDELVALGILPSAAAGDARRSEAVGATTVGALIEKWVSAGRLTPLQAEAIRSGMHRKLLVADYVLLDEIGEGGMGRVYKARHRHMQRLVALKVLCGSSDAEEALLRFQREVEAAARLAHPNIVTAYDAGFVDGEPYLVMEYVDGRSLAEILRGRRPLEISQAVDLILQAARGLAYAHGRGVVHRDVKPSNLLVDCAGTVKILDMGLARLHVSGTETSDEDGLTDSGQILGTVDYMAPEQARNTHQADHRADIYSLGCTLYRCLTGTIPYGGTSSIDKLMAHRELPIPALGEHRPDVPPELEAVYSRMVAKNPDERFQSMNDVIRALEHVRSIEGAAGGPSLAAAVVAEDASDDTSFPNGLTNPPSAQRLGRGGLGTTVLYDGSQSAAPEAAPGRRGRTPSRRTLIAMASLVLAAVAAVIVIVRNREGKEVARLQLDEGATIEVQSAGGPAAASIAPSANGRRDEDPPPDQPTPRETAHWVLGRGGKLIVVVGDASREVTAADQLPDGKFHIRRIDFRGVKMISDNGFARIASLGELEQLYLGESSVSDKALVHVRDLKALKVLDLLKTRVTDDGMPHLTRLRNLSLLNLQGTRVTDAGVEPLKSLTGLGQLTLRETRVTEAGKSDFEAAVPGCRVVWP